MVLILPDSLLLLALHPERGTILPPAYLAIDLGLRGAILAELKLSGHVQSRRDGAIRMNPRGLEPPQHPALRDAVDVLTEADGPAAARSWFELLERRRPDLRESVTSVLRTKGILRTEDRQRSYLPQQTTLPAANPHYREELVVRQRAALDDGDGISPRDGMLLALVVGCRLERAVFGARADEALARAEWVRDREAIVRTTAVLVNETEV